MLAFFALTTFASIYTDRLWYTSEGYGEVFSKLFWTRTSLFLIFGLLMGVAVGANMYLAHRFRPFFRPDSPEQAGLLDYPMDERSDMYSAGIILFECLAGRTPFQGSSMGEVLRQHLTAHPLELRSLGLAVPRALDEAIQRLLRKDPRERYQTAGAAHERSQEVAPRPAHTTGRAPHPRGGRPRRRQRRRRRRRRSNR